MNFDYLNANLYKGAFHAFRHNLPMALTAAALLLFLEFLTPVFGIGAVTTIAPEIFLEIGVAFAIHTTILTGIPNNWKEQFGVRGQSYSYKSFMKKSWALFGLTFAVMVALGGFAFFAAPYLGGEKKEMLIGLFAILIILVGLPLVGVILSIYGTILPATVAEQDSSFPAAFHRSKGLFWFTFGRLAYDPTLFALLFIIFGAGLNMMGTPVDVYTESGAFDLIGTILSFILYALRMFGLELTAMVLCKTYLKSVERSDQPA